jgi:hypothetical protein
MEDLFWISKNWHFQVLKKFWKKFIDVDNDELYPLAKNQCEIYCILGYVKMKKFQIWDDKQYQIQKSSDLLNFVIFV